MKTITLNKINRTYKNNGQHAEQVLRYTLTGEIVKADNVSHDKAGDIFDIQVKSSRATVCKGTDLNKHLAADKAERFAYVESTFSVAYIMNRAEYIEFVNEFGSLDRESAKNGGGVKIRLRSESRTMREWFMARV